MNNKNWEQILSKAGCAVKEAREFAPYFAKYCGEHKINTPPRVSAFLANVMVESNYLRTMRENLRYSAQGLANTWPNRFSTTKRKGGKPNSLALSIAGKPKQIANSVYANRMGNGDPETGDGWKHSGKGPIQITGKSNYLKFFRDNNLPLSTDPERLTEPDLGTCSAVWYWTVNKINYYADMGQFDHCCDMVNIGRPTATVGDSHGFKQRKLIYANLLTFLKIHEYLITSANRQLVIDDKTMEKQIAPEIKWDAQDPLGEHPEWREMYFDYVKEFTPL